MQQRRDNIRWQLSNLLTIPVIGPEQGRITIGMLLDSLESDFKLRGKDTLPFQAFLKAVRDYWGDRLAVQVTVDDVNATCNRRTQLLGQAYKLAIRNKKLSSAPYISRLSEVGNERQGFFEKADFDRVLLQLPEYLRDFVQRAFLIGWRKGALKSLRWTDVTDDVIFLRAKNSKTRKPESVPLEGELKELIERRRAQQVWEDAQGQAHFSEYVFHQGDGRPIGDFRKSWKTACRLAGVTGMLFHDLRRTAGRNLIRAGVPESVAMKITGHRTNAMFRRYAIVAEEQKREALAKMQNYLQNQQERKVITMR